MIACHKKEIPHDLSQARFLGLPVEHLGSFGIMRIL